MDDLPALRAEVAALRQQLAETHALLVRGFARLLLARWGMPPGVEWSPEAALAQIREWEASLARPTPSPEAGGEAP